MNYANYLDYLLSTISVPYDIIMDDMSYDNHRSIEKIEKFYSDIISCINVAVTNVIPSMYDVV